LTSQILPFLQRRDSGSGRRNLEMIGPGAAAGTAFTGAYDGGGGVIRFQSTPDQRSVAFLPCTAFFDDPSASQQVRCQALQDVLSNLLAQQPSSKK
jgi:hypothetical protein